MASTNFVDYVKILFRSGKGGAGSVHFHRDKLTAKGGPDGGDGGRGGHIILRGNSQLWTLIHLKYTKHVYAEDGHKGEGSNKSGANGKDVVLEVPLGTIARDPETGKVHCEILAHGEEKIFMKGGRGGQGNQHFATATRQTPQFAQPGEPSIEAWKILELKVLADVGLVGFPNAGKSTLLSVLSAAKPEIADYPFTTLIPNLGIVKMKSHHSFVMADIPGIIEGAHLGKGLGLRFLRHIERNPVLLFMIPVDAPDIKKEYKILLNELKKFNPDLLLKKKVLAITKCDQADEELVKLIKKELPRTIPHIFISSWNKKGLNDLKDLLWKQLNADL